MRDPPKLNEFEASTYAAWRELVERDLAGAPFEKRLVRRVGGLDIQPLYVRSSSLDEGPDAAGLPGFAPFTRGAEVLGAAQRGWDVRPEIADADPASAGRAILDELRGGATSIALRLAGATRRGTVLPSPAGGTRTDGVVLTGLADLEVALEHVALDRVPLALDAGASALPVAAALFALAAKRSVTPAALAGAFGADPLATLAAEGGLPTSLASALEEVAELAAWTAHHAPSVRTLTIDTSVYHDAGAEPAIEIALALATGLSYLRALTDAGLTLDVATRQLAFTFSIGRDFFLEVAKLRAARCTWANVVAACGGGPDSQAMTLFARTSWRTKTQRDPWVNLVRGTAESFSAALGGAHAITTTTFDSALGESDDFSRRLARNTQHVLQGESNVHRVVDPAGGSWYIESITGGLAREAWERFRAIERSGGMAEALASGTLQAELKVLLDAVREGVERRKTVIIGVNEFPNVHEDGPRPREERRAPSQRLAVPAPVAPPGGDVARGRFTRGSRVAQAIHAMSDGATFLDVRAALDSGTPAKVTALARERLSRPFETLRDRSDRIAATTGKRPIAFLAALGPLSEHAPRRAFAQSFFESGGFTVLSSDIGTSADAVGLAFAESGADIAVICSSDSVNAQLAQPVARALRAKGAKVVVLAGAPGSHEAAYRDAGISDFVFVGVNVVECLSSLLDRAHAGLAS